MKIYIVQGSGGDYLDHREWVVCAYRDEKQAQDHVVAASARARDLMAQYKARWCIPSGANEHDPQMDVDYTGVNYNVLECELRD